MQSDISITTENVFGLLVYVVHIVFFRMHCFKVSLKLFLPRSVELAMLAFDAFSFGRHPRPLDVNPLHVTFHFVVARQDLVANGARDLLPTF